MRKPEWMDPAVGLLQGALVAWFAIVMVVVFVGSSVLVGAVVLEFVAELLR